MKTNHYSLTKYLAMLAVIFISINMHAQHIRKLLGPATGGGVFGSGTICSYNFTDNTLISELSFPATSGNPGSELASNGNGIFYGMTDNGIFEWNPVTSSYSMKIDSISIGMGQGYAGAMLLYNNKFYGMRTGGGANNQGVIFEWDPVANIYTKKFDFDAVSTGYMPKGSFTEFNGKLYGLTSQGGSAGGGTLFEWDPATNSFTLKYDFVNSLNGNNPQSTLATDGSMLYGTTFMGGSNFLGTIFQWDPSSNIFTKKIDFNFTNGDHPSGKMVFDGTNFYGLTEINAYMWNPNTNIISSLFNATFGTYGINSMTLIGNQLYGLTENGGSSSSGSIYKWDISAAQLTTVYNFDNGQNGGYPYSSMLEQNGKLYGVTYSGGLMGVGVFFEYELNAGTYQKLYDFGMRGYGDNPSGKLLFYAGKYYGVTAEGGLFNKGTLYEWDPLTKLITSKVDFDGANGAGPVGTTLTLYNNKFYGLASAGGNNNMGTLFEWNPDSANIIKKMDFSGLATGSFPLGTLVLHNNVMYGICNNGGINNAGVIFEWNPITEVFTKKFDFGSGSGNGKNPFSSLALYNNMFYGLTTSGGSTNKGVLFEWDPGSNVYTKKLDFTGNSGSIPGGNPYSSLTLFNNFFYGSTVTGGANSAGVLFEWNPSNNTYNVLYNFTMGISGHNCYATLLESNGLLYGQTRLGGTYSKGVVFQYDLSDSSYTKLSDYDGINGANPLYCTLIEITEPNTAPVLFNYPSAITVCSNSISDSITFSYYDAENDTALFTFYTSDSLLIPVNSMSVFSTASGLNFKFSHTAGMSGSAVITLIADDGYGGFDSLQLTVDIQGINNGISVLTDTLMANATNSLYQWIDCNNAFQPINTANGQIFVPSASGYYAAIINTNGCIDTSACYGIVLTEIKSNYITTPDNKECTVISPNPNNGKFTVTVQGDEKEKTTISITDASGKQLLNKTLKGEKGKLDTAIDLTNEKAGVYIITITQGKKMTQKKVVIE